MNEDSIQILHAAKQSQDAPHFQELLNTYTKNSRRKMSFRFYTADCLSFALDMIEQNHFDLIFLDLSLPDSHGIDTLNQIQKMNSHVPIVILGEADDEPLFLQAVRAGAQDYLVKGEVNGNQLVRTICCSLVRKEEEEAIKETNRKLKELNQMKRNFLSTISHDLRTPIAIMREGVSLCLEGVAGEINDMQKDLLNYTQENIDRINRLITDLMDVLKIEAEKTILKPVSVNINHLLQKIYDSYFDSAQKKGIRLEKQIPEAPLTIFADPDKITQIFGILINNALRFTEQGGSITLGIQDGDEYITCRVADTGTGIPKENLAGLFDQYEQMGRVEDGPSCQRTGPGVTIAKILVEKHQGTINVKSESEQGTEFRFTLKKAPFPKILIAGHKRETVDTLKEFLIQEQYHIMEVCDGGKAVQQACKVLPDLILLDMKLPKINGYEVIGRLKQDVRTCHLPIIMMNTSSSKKEVPYAAFPVLKEPFNKKELLKYVRKMLIN
ncbi:response regulator [bacterium]|nr:response regulator [bacterium]